MISRLRNRGRVGVLNNNDRARTLKWGKWIYLILLFVFAGSLVNYIVGSTIFLRAEGIVLRPVTVVAAPYDAHVRQIEVRPGQVVEQGARLASLQSAAMTRSLSDLASQQASLRVRVAQLESRFAIVTQVLPLARQSEKESAHYFELVQSLARTGNLNAARLQETAVANYNATERRIALSAELDAISKELEVNREMLAKADNASEQLQAIYNQGEIISPASGTIGPSVASEGEVLVTGKPVLEIFRGERYVLAFLPNEYLFSIREGEKVSVNSGGDSVVGTIEEVLPVADSLPPEFRTSFGARERSRLIRINLAHNSRFAIQQQVEIRSCLSSSCENAGSVAMLLGSAIKSSLQKFFAEQATASPSTTSTISGAPGGDPSGLRRQGKRVALARISSLRQRIWLACDSGHDQVGSPTLTFAAFHERTPLLSIAEQLVCTACGEHKAQHCWPEPESFESKTPEP